MGCLRSWFAVVACASALLAAPAAAGNRPDAMPLGGFVKAPIAHVKFCERIPGECRPGPDAMAGPLPLTRATMALVARINASVNASVTPATDMAVYGVPERWDYPMGRGRGDCEDFALLKRRLLHDTAKISFANLLMTIVRKASGEGHAVLTLRTTAGDFILDNLDWTVKPWRETPYAYLMRQDSQDPARWHAIDSGAVAMVSAVGR